MTLKARRKIRGITALLMSAALFFSCASPAFSSGAPGDSVSFVTASGLFYTAKEHRDDYSREFLNYERSKEIQAQQADSLIKSSLDAVGKMKKDGVSYLFLLGGLSSAGEYDNHFVLSQKLEEFEGVSGVNVIAVPGPKDLYNNEACFIEKGRRISAPTVTASGFRDIYSSLGLDLAGSDVYYKSSKDDRPGSCSYSVKAGKVRFIVIDAMEHSEDETGATERNRGYIGSELLKWIKRQISFAIASGETPIGVSAWGFGAGKLRSEGVVENGEEILDELADAGMHYICTAGSDINDARKHIADSGETIFEIGTGQLLRFPNLMRKCVFSKNDGLFSEAVEPDSTADIVSRPDKDGNAEVFSRPYRRTGSLDAQYASKDLARHYADMADNFIRNSLYPGIKRSGSLEKYLKEKYGLDAAEWIDSNMGGGINIFGYFVLFDSTNVLNLINSDVIPQFEAKFLRDPDKLGRIIYSGLREAFDAIVSQEKCVKYLSSHSFGSADRGGTLEDLLLSLFTVLREGNENIDDDAFLKDVRRNIKTGELVTFMANVIKKCVVKKIMLEGILSEIEVRPQYLVKLDSSQNSLGSGMQTAFTYYLRLHGQENSYYGFLKALLQGNSFLSIFTGGKYRRFAGNVDDLLDRFVKENFTGDRARAAGENILELFDEATDDANPSKLGDFGVAYKYAGKEKPPLKKGVTRLALTYGEDPSSSCNISWYTSTKSKNTNVEIYDSKTQSFTGKNFVGAAGAKIKAQSFEKEGKYSLIGLDFAGIGDKKELSRRHALQIAGLKSGRTYFIRVGDETAGIWSDTIRFTPADSSDTLSFIHMTGTEAIDAKQYRELKNMFLCEDKYFPDHDFLLLTGSMASGKNDTRRWEKFLEAYSSSNPRPVVPANGSAEKGTTALRDNFLINQLASEKRRADYYSFDMNGVHFAVLDTTRATLGGALSDEQQRFLKEDLKNTKCKWKVLAFSSDVYTVSSKAGTTRHTSFRENMAKLCDLYDVDLVLTGSDGIYYRTDVVKGSKVTGRPNVSYRYDGMEHGTVVKPDGTVFSALGFSGANSAREREVKDVTRFFKVSGKQINTDKPMFSRVKISGDNLLLMTYTLDGSRLSLVDSMLLKKTQDSYFTRGDVNRDGKITAEDARLALRISAKLEKCDGPTFSAADVDINGKITAADARIILRVSAKLQTL